MKRIWIAGNAGSGKTTLADALGKRNNIPVYHRDYISWDENLNTRSESEQVAMLRDITARECWIFEGARFTAAKIDGRLERCDTIIHLNINRFVCVFRAINRWRKQIGKNLPPADYQPFTFSHIKSTLIDYPQKAHQRAEILEQAKQKGIHIIEIKTLSQLNKFYRDHNLSFHNQ